MLYSIWRSASLSYCIFLVYLLLARISRHGTKKEAIERSAFEGIQRSAFEGIERSSLERLFQGVERSVFNGTKRSAFEGIERSAFGEPSTGFVLWSGRSGFVLGSFRIHFGLTPCLQVRCHVSIGFRQLSAEPPQATRRAYATCIRAYTLLTRKPHGKHGDGC